ncbi:hypothetical protein QEZ54_09590 [Catellatospora sp. KI3]|uniref:hypothetical protein n=1 Tax=Catellatospora sp. KI3 TaxID=3041620 RepID=UPI002482256A|nr:hypothetical protein [Catellatospora sp. KI3]MDI1461218.1 hypothetical protein [Catellatospora sp. KI3]
MAVVLIHEGPTLTQERYDQIVLRLTGGSGRMQSVADWPVSGLLMHVAGQSPHGFRVVDVWESEEACQRFGEILKPILAEVGVTDQAQVYPPHAFVAA